MLHFLVLQFHIYCVKYQNAAYFSFLVLQFHIYCVKYQNAAFFSFTVSISSLLSTKLLHFLVLQFPYLRCQVPKYCIF